MAGRESVEMFNVTFKVVVKSPPPSGEGQWLIKPVEGATVKISARRKVVATCKTGQDGTCTIAKEAGYYRKQAFHPDYDPSRVYFEDFRDGESEQLRLKLKKESPILIPVYDLVVKVIGKVNPEVYAKVTLTNGRTNWGYTDITGRKFFPKIPKGDYIVSAKKGDVRSEYKPVTLDEDKNITIYLYGKPEEKVKKTRTAHRKPKKKHRPKHLYTAIS